MTEVTEGETERGSETVRETEREGELRTTEDGQRETSNDEQWVGKSEHTPQNLGLEAGLKGGLYGYFFSGRQFSGGFTGRAFLGF
jgi:hypothetical protein